jgi:hypothetical protein
MLIDRRNHAAKRLEAIGEPGAAASATLAVFQARNAASPPVCARALDAFCQPSG